ncbi:type 1 glutamine amidotransferase [Piscinibacter koreensis]|uniref:Type 1 glutamine amidotransferase n=1 Tax=Piscinibacter koreensis TaxID=2742824 RepID=A0A7Y6NSA2_9BURK|nr:type 1 glutamine amidotransferase [Schlegelella koreensis]NUZ08257.1 type 1 glutamine amidotransferase [Schlegelella koreensis]
MKPIAIFQHDDTQRPGFLKQTLEELGIEQRTFVPEADPGYVPRDARDFSGIVLLGSNRSVNDPLSWIEREARLVRAAMDADIPVLGHCFGAQLMARALGAVVCRNAWPDIGWSRLRAVPAGRGVFAQPEVWAFNWHYETFAIPPGAQRLLTSAHCMNKAFAIGKHLAFQCHFEVTEDIVREWLDGSANELLAASGPAVQQRDAILAQLPHVLPAVHAAAGRIYRRWALGLARPPLVSVGGGS